MSKKIEYAYSFDEERYYKGGSPEETNRIAVSEMGGQDFYYVGEVVQPANKSVLDDFFDSIMDNLDDNINCEYGEYAENYAGEISGASEELKKSFIECLDRLGIKPEFFQVTNIKKVDISKLSQEDTSDGE